MEGNGGPGRFRAVVAVLETVGVGVEAPEEEESGDGGGEEDEYHPQRAHFPPLYLLA